MMRARILATGLVIVVIVCSAAVGSMFGPTRTLTRTKVRTVHDAPPVQVVDITCPNGLVRHLVIDRHRGRLDCRP